LVFDYVAGKLDWLANDLPYEGELSETPTLGKAVDRSAVLTCSVNESCAAVQRRMQEAAKAFCVAVDDAGIVLGIVLDGAESGMGARVEQVMKAGPTTLRPHVAVAEAAELSRRQQLDPVLVTSSDGRLLGALSAADLAETR
jgi:CBS domain-containing protein